MNVEYVGTINNQKLATRMLFVETFFIKTIFYKLGTPSMHNSLFRRNFESKN